MSWLHFHLYRKKILLGVALIGTFFLFEAFQSRHSEGDRGAASLSSVSSQDEAVQAQEDLVREKVPEALSIAKGDTKSLNALLKSRFGLKIKEIKQNADGSFDAVISGGDPVTLRSAPVLSPSEESEYRSQIIQFENQNKQVEVTERDRNEMAAFRKGVLGL